MGKLKKNTGALVGRLNTNNAKKKQVTENLVVTKVTINELDKMTLKFQQDIICYF